MFQNEETFIPGKAAEVELKPSQAMRIGAAMRPQCVGGPFSGGGSCALGAMYEGYGLGRDDDYDVYRVAHERLPYGVVGQVWRKNDQERLTREQIADWLEEQGY